MPITDLNDSIARGDIKLGHLLTEFDRRLGGELAPIDLTGISTRALRLALLERLLSVHGSSDLVNVPQPGLPIPPDLEIHLGLLSIPQEARPEYVAELRRDEEGVAILFARAALGEVEDGYVTIATQRLRDRYTLCDDRFGREPVIPAARGSGFLVAREPGATHSSHLVTASHCVKPAALADTCVLFTFDRAASQGGRLRVPVADIFTLRREVKRDNSADWVILELDRPVTGRTIRPLASERIGDQAWVHIAGHPLGLPRKLAGNGVVRDNTAPAQFRASVDAYGGNSGSPIFDARSHAVVGMLVSGNEDLMPTYGCNLDHCIADQCPGELCTRVTTFAQFVP